MATLEEVPDRVLLAPEHNAAVTVAEDNDPGTWIETGFGEHSEGDLHGPVIVHDDFGWFPDHSTSVPSPR
ncbi:hypothetical protein ACGF07_10380 [Kitasatospora sp. NPDC048194]|uniref:hypothetical protein n=1 Tax=Kitasatospora sp. NPDC048194 TaxID=3364045 RepID=UPI003717137F